MTGREVYLRAMEPEDLDFLYNMENDRELWNVGNANAPYSRYVLHDYIANASNDIYNDGQVRMIVENERHDTIGLVDILNFCPQHNRAEVSVVIQKKYRGNGYASLAMRKIHTYSVRILHLHQLYAIVAESNTASLTLFDSLGYSRRNLLEEWLFDGSKYENGVVMQKIFEKNS